MENSPAWWIMYEQAAKRLGVPVSVVKAVALVESSGKGFLDDGRCVIRFEPHIFSQQTGGKYDRSHPHLSNPVFSPQRFGSWPIYDQAVSLDMSAAMRSTSWGAFQIMGFNFAACGFKTVIEFVAAQCKSEKAQLDAWLGFVESQGLVKFLQMRDWPSFAARYNGIGYKVNRYDSRIAEAVARFEKGVVK